MPASIELASLDTSRYLRGPFLRQYLLYEFRRVVRNNAEMIRAHIQANMKAPKHGRTYIKGGRKHIASAPGEAPAIDTGNLFNSLKIEYGRGAGYPTGAFAHIGTWTTGYAGYLEGGTTKMAKRPFADPARQALQDRFVHDIRRAVSRTFA